MRKQFFKMRPFVFVFFLASFLGACEKIETGYLSDHIRYTSDPLIVKQGAFLLSTALIPDNSTPPLKVTLLDVRDVATGKRAESFFKEYQIYKWKSPYNPSADTTLELINAKRELVSEPPIQVLPSSGQILLNEGTINIPEGEYTLDIQVENVKAVKTYKDICKIIIQPLIPFVYNNPPYSLASYTDREEFIRFPFDADWVNSETGEGVSAKLTIRQVADTPNQVILKVMDKNGALFPKEAISLRPSGSEYLKTLGTFAYKTTFTDTGIVYDYATVPFPHPYWDAQSNGINCYYRIYSDYIASIDTLDAATFIPPGVANYGEWNKVPVNLSMRFNTRIYKPGKYIYELILKAKKK